MFRKKRKRRRAGNFPTRARDPSTLKVDDSKLWAKCDQLAQDLAINDLKEFIKSISAIQPERAEVILQMVKFKHPKAYRLLLSEKTESGPLSEELIDEQVINKESNLAKASKGKRTMSLRNRNRRRTSRLADRLPEPRRRRAENLYVEDEDLRPSRRRRRRAQEEEERLPRRRRRAEEGSSFPRRRRRRLSEDEPRRPSIFDRRRKAEDDDEPAEEMGFEFEDLSLDDLDLEGLELEEEEMGEGLEGEEEEGCPEGQELKCVPVEEGEEEKEDEEEEGEEEEGAEAEGEEEEEGVGETAAAEEVVDEDDEKEKEAATPLMERVYSSRDLEPLKNARFDFIPFGINPEDENYDLFKDDPSYSIFAMGHPLAEIRLSDTGLKDEFKALFYKPSYIDRIKEGFTTFGVEETLKSVNARFYATAAYENDIASEVKAQLREETMAERRATLADLKDQFMNVMAIVAEGSVKNYWGENPLKEDIVNQFNSLGIDTNTCVNKIESAFRKSGASYLEMLINKADELLGAHEDVLKHHTAEIASMEWRHPGYAVEEETIPVAASAQQRAPQVPRSVPITTGHGTPVVAETRQAGGRKWDPDFWRQRMKGRLSNRTASALTVGYESFKRKTGK